MQGLNLAESATASRLSRCVEKLITHESCVSYESLRASPHIYVFDFLWVVVSASEQFRHVRFSEVFQLDNKVRTP